MCKLARMWRIWADIRHFSLSISILLFETLTLCHDDTLPGDWPAPGILSPFLPDPQDWVTDSCLWVWLLLRYWGSNPRSRHQPSKHPAQSAISLPGMSVFHLRLLKLHISCSEYHVESEVWSVGDERSLPSFPSEPVLFLCSLFAPARMSVKCWIGCAYSWVLIISWSEDLIFLLLSKMVAVAFYPNVLYLL